MALPYPAAVPVTGAALALSKIDPATTALATRERRNSVTRTALRQRVAAEFTEMPGLQLTAPQAWRLFALRSDVCLRVLAELADQGVLCRTADGQFARREAR
jgi:hypothetical protein